MRYERVERLLGPSSGDDTNNTLVYNVDNVLLISKRHLILLYSRATS